MGDIASSFDYFGRFYSSWAEFLFVYIAWALVEHFTLWTQGRLVELFWEILRCTLSYFFFYLYRRSFYICIFIYHYYLHRGEMGKKEKKIFRQTHKLDPL